MAGAHQLPQVSHWAGTEDVPQTLHGVGQGFSLCGTAQRYRDIEVTSYKQGDSKVAGLQCQVAMKS